MFSGNNTGERTLGSSLMTTINPDGLSDELNIFNVKGEFINSLKSPGHFDPGDSYNWMVLTDSSYFVQIPNKTGTERYRIALIKNEGDILQSFANTHFFNDDYRRVNLEA